MPMSLPDDRPYHAHVYFLPDQRAAAKHLRGKLEANANVLFVGRMTEGKAGPHPIPQFEAHFLQGSVDEIRSMLIASGLRVLIHPLTDDDVADHTTLGEWLGEPVKLDLTALDPPGMNQGIPRFGKTDF
jgi:aromatic ring-cleaving dioxygenase